MAGGPILPFSCEPITTSRTFPTRLDPKYPRSLGYEASLGADSIWRCFYKMPPAIPLGTFKVSLMGQANATSGNAKVNVKWKCWSPGAAPDPASLTAEGVDTITFATTAYLLTEVVRVLDASTAPTANQILQIDFTGETSSWTLAVVLGLLPPPVYWE